MSLPRAWRPPGAVLALGLAGGAGPARAAVGLSDAFGDSWIDGAEPGGPTCDPNDLLPSGQLGPCGDEWFARDIGFVFDSYGEATPGAAAVLAPSALPRRRRTGGSR